MTEKKVTLALAMIVAIAVVGMLIAGLGAFALDSEGITLSGAALVSLSAVTWILWALAFFLALIVQKIKA